MNSAILLAELQKKHSMTSPSTTLDTGVADHGYDGFDGYDGDDFEDGGDSNRGVGFKRGKGDARRYRGEQVEEEVVDSAGVDGDVSGSGGSGGDVGGFVATGFADGFRRLEDQEAGYASFAAFLVRVLDQMP